MPNVRAATENDLPSILAIYNEVIATSTAVYALEPATLDERQAWYTSRSATGSRRAGSFRSPRTAAARLATTASMSG